MFDLQTLNLIAGIIASAIVSIGTVSGWVLWLANRIKKDFIRLEAEIEKVSREGNEAINALKRDADLKIAAADARAKIAEEGLAKSLADHKLYAAEHFATEDGVSKAIEPVIKAIDRLAERLDQLLIGGMPTRPGPSRTRA